MHEYKSKSEPSHDGVGRKLDILIVVVVLVAEETGVTPQILFAQV
jgi:hypothetical protein